MRNPREKSYWVGDNYYGFPVIEGVDIIPKKLLPFRKTKNKDGYAHFFMYDYMFNGLWANPDRYINILSQYEGVLSPDWSLFRDYPLAVQIFNVYRNRAIAIQWQFKGLNVIPTVGWSDEKSYDFCFEGLPKNATLAISSSGVIRNKESTKYFLKGYEEMIKRLNPKNVIMMGRNPWGLDVIEYPSWDMFKESKERGFGNIARKEA